MKLPKYLFWVSQAREVAWAPFWWVYVFIFILWVPFLRVWWWFFLPLMLASQLKELYLWWLEWDFDYAKQKWVLLEMVPPKEILVPLKAMEDVFNVAWPLYDHPTFRDKWCDGMLDNGPYWCSWEIVSTEGRVHYYLKCNAANRLTLETALYAHYPDLEIREVPDYVKAVPQTIPNEEWDMYGEDYDFRKDDALPLKTYEKFFEPQGEKISAEEKRIDPIISLLESLSRLGPGENYWIQFITVPITEIDEPGWKKAGESIVNKLAKRPEKKKTTFLEDLFYVLSQLFLGPAKEGSGDKASYSWVPQTKEETGEREMVLTPGERETITEIENKLKKPAFRTTVRGVYVAKRENWKSPHSVIMRSYVAHFNSNDALNSIGFQVATRPKVKYFWRKRRVFLRARKMFRNTVLRFPPLFPHRLSAHLNPILSAEEMATLYHFPLRVTGMVTPTMSKVDAKRAGPPPNLPIE